MELNNQLIYRIAMEQSAIDLNCRWDDFCQTENRLVISKKDPAARRYLTLPFACNLVSYGNNIVASVAEEHRELVKSYIDRYSVEHCFETPNMQVLNDAFAQKGLRVCFMAEYFLPDISLLSPIDCGYRLKPMDKSDFAALYLPEWSNALCEKRKELDMIGVGAFDGEKLVGLAGASADCEQMWQIGVDVLPSYRRHGIAAAVTSHLAAEIIKRGKVPFYCAAWSNLGSVRNAIKSGFRPAWVELTVKEQEFVDKMNNG